MNRQGRVLVVDDLPIWYEGLVKTLQNGGFFAEFATTTSQVFEKLDQTLYHILLLDIRLNDSDPTNIEGLDLLGDLDERELSEAIKVIMLSSYDTKAQMHKAFTEHGVADFLSKDDFKPQALLDAVRKAFREEVRINLSLDVHWQHLSAEQAVLNIAVNGIRVKNNTTLQSQMAFELDDLLCRLFSEAVSVLLQPLASGQSSTSVLRVQPFYTVGGGRTVVVKFGEFRKIKEEYANFKKYVQPFVGGGRNTTALDMRQTSHLGGITYSLLGTSDDHLENFGSFYRRATIPQIKDALDKLFFDTCGAWYANLSQLRPYNLTEDYQQLFGFTQEKLEQAFFKLKAVQLKSMRDRPKPKLKFTSLDSERLFTNPLPLLAGQPLVRSTYVCTTHGDFNHQNLLVDSSEHMWLIDFQNTGPSHILRDVVLLDSDVRFHLLAPEDASLEERLKMEEVLCSIKLFSQLDRLSANLPTENRPLAKAFAIIVHLQTIAHKLIAQNTSDDISEYYIALFYKALNELRYIASPSEQREHALLCASLLADRLGLRE